MQPGADPWGEDGQGQMISELIDPILASPEVTLAKNLCLLFFVVFTVALVFWTWRDASRRGALPWLWAVVALVFNVFGWFIYMVVRPPDTIEEEQERLLEISAREAEIHRTGQTCPSCETPIESEFLVCPSCMMNLRKPCTNCDRALQLDWTVCPYCRTKQ